MRGEGERSPRPFGLPPAWRGMAATRPGGSWCEGEGGAGPRAHTAGSPWAPPSTTSPLVCAACCPPELGSLNDVVPLPWSHGTHALPWTWVLRVVSKPDSLRWSVKRQSLCPIWREQRLRLGPTQAKHPSCVLRHLSPTAGSQSHSCSAQRPGRLCPKTGGGEAPASVRLLHREEGTAPQ